MPTKSKARSQNQPSPGRVISPLPQPNPDRLMKVALKFVGSWIGQTMGYDDSPAHIWEIKLQGYYLQIETRWEGDARSGHFFCMPLENEDAFQILNNKKAILVDAQHFYIPDWDTNDIRGGKGPAYDVIFSRPGLAELNAEEAWGRIKATATDASVNE